MEDPITTLSNKSDVKPFTDYASGEAFQLVSFTTKQNYFARYDPEEGITPFCREWVEILTDKKRVNKEFGNDMYRIVIEAIQQVHGENRLFNQFQMPFILDLLPEKRGSQSRYDSTSKYMTEYRYQLIDSFGYPLKCIQNY